MPATITVTGTYVGEDGTTPPKGVVTFKLSGSLQDSSTNGIITPVPIKAKLDETGSISVSLIAPDDPALQPTGVTYLVTESIRKAPARTYSINVPYNTPGGVLDLADVAPVSSTAPIFQYALVSHNHAAAAISFTPPTGWTATDTQAAIVEAPSHAAAAVHPNLAVHDSLGLATQAELDAVATGVPTTEQIQDVVAALLVAGTNVGLSYDDTANTLTISSTDTTLATEQVQDIVGAFVSGTSGVTATYDDAANTLTVSIGNGAITNAMLAGSIALSKLATDPLARANHTGTQTASTISDFDTQVRTSRLDQMAAPTASVPLNAQKITGLADPTLAQDAATRAYVLAVRDALVASAPGALDTLNELATALGNDANFATTTTNALAGKQPLDTDLTAIAALVSAADKIAYATGAGTWALTTVTSYVRTLLDDPDAATARTTLGLGTSATQDKVAAGNAGVLDATDATTTNTRTPTDNTVSTAKLVDAAVTNAKLANMANATVKGRNTAGTGPSEDVSMAQLRTLLSLVVGTNVQAWDTDLDTLAAGGAGATTLLRSLLDSTYGAFDAEIKLTAKFTASAAVSQVVGASGNQLQTSFVARGSYEKVTVEVCGICTGQAWEAFNLLWADNASASFPLWQAASTSGGLTLKSGAALESLGNIDVDSFDTISKSLLIPTTPGHTYNVQVIVSIVGGGLFIPSVGLTSGGGSWSSIAATPDRRKVYLGLPSKVVVLHTPSHAGRDQAWERSPRHQTGGSFAIGGTATQLSVTPDGTRLVVASTDGHVYVVDTSTDAIVGTYTMPGTTPQPLGAACVSNTTAYVSDATNNKVYPFTISSGAFGSAITVGTTPLRIHANSAGTYVAVPNNGTNTLSIIKVSDNSVVTVTFTSSARPASVAWMPDSSALWVVDSANKKVISVTTPTGTPAVGTTTTAFNPGGGIGAIAIDADGQTAWVSGISTGADHNVHMAQLWVSGPYAGSWFITDVNSDWGCGATTGANDAVIDAAGNIMWADFNNGYLENPGSLVTCDPTFGFTNEYGHMALEALQ